MLMNEVISEIKKLRVEDGDIVFFGFRNGVPVVKAAQLMQIILKKMRYGLGIKKVLLIPLFHGDTVAALNEADMNANGWFRKTDGEKENGFKK